jgi:hypothetical protein
MKIFLVLFFIKLIMSTLENHVFFAHPFGVQVGLIYWGFHLDITAFYLSVD